jgi:dipeptidyl aminopeptidase/acylaminoacyl peptidase
MNRVVRTALFSSLLTACQNTAPPQTPVPAVVSTAPAPPSSAAAPPPPSVAPPRADPGLLRRKVLFGNSDHSSPTLSPNGKKLAFLAPDDGVMNVWVGPADDPKAAKVVTHERTRPIRDVRWAFTGEHVVYTNDKGGDENFHIFSVDLKSTETKDLTPFEGVRADLLATFETHPTLLHAQMNKRDKKYMDPIVLDVKTGKLQVLAENTQEFADYLADRDAKLRLASKITPDGGQEWFTAGRNGAEWTSYAKILPEDAFTTETMFFQSNNRTVYLRDSRGRDTSALVALDLSGDKLKVLFADAQTDVERIMAHPRTHVIQAVATNRERRVWHVLDKAIEPDLEALAKVSPGDLQVVSRSLDDERWIASFARDDAPTGFYLWDRAKKKATFLFVDRNDLTQAKLVKMHPVVIPARDGLELVSYLSLPAGSDSQREGRPDRALPMVLLVHGGPWARDHWGLDNFHQWLASRGYAVLSVNFRGSTGFGKRFINAGNLEWGAKMQDDLVDAVKWAIDQKIADSTKVAIMGGSYGGYATLIGLTFTPELFACGVDIVGPSNLVTLLDSIPPYWTPMLSMFTQRVGDHTSEEGKKFLFSRSALSRVDAIKKPLLIGQGANDPRVKQAESEQIVRAMQAKKLPVTYVLYPDEGHGFARPENRLSFYAVAEIFLAERLGGSYQPVGSDFENSSISVPNGADQIAGLTEALARK